MVELITLEKIKFNKKIIRKEGRVDYIYILNQFDSVAKKYYTSSYLRLIDLYICIAWIFSNYLNVGHSLGMS